MAQVVDLYNREQWNAEMKKALEELDLEGKKESVLGFLFHFGMPEHKLNLQKFESREETMKLMNIVLDPYRIKFQ